MRFGPTGILIGDFELITYYGIILMLGALAGAWLAGREAKRRGLDPELVWDGLLWVLIGGVVGARLWHVFTPPPSMVAAGYTTAFYLTHPLDLINTRLGGLGIPGAIIGGALALYLFCRRRKFSFAVWADIAAPGLALGQAIGRWGNYINQEVYGARTDLPWGIYIQREGAKFHPLFFYESVWNLANMALLLWLGRRYAHRLKDGDLLLVYLIVYPLGRFLLEFLRLDSALISGLNINQAIAALAAVAGIALLYWRHRPTQSETAIQQPVEKE
ncbi:MAG: prolipoprotein diacylglyceryl transferase [Chloroflexota bacterium]